jgi:hypothetical protein
MINQSNIKEVLISMGFHKEKMTHAGQFEMGAIAFGVLPPNYNPLSDPFLHIKR